MRRTLALPLPIGFLVVLVALFTVALAAPSAHAKSTQTNYVFSANLADLSVANNTVNVGDVKAENSAAKKALKLERVKSKKHKRRGRHQQVFSSATVAIGDSTDVVDDNGDELTLDDIDADFDLVDNVVLTFRDTRGLLASSIFRGTPEELAVTFVDDNGGGDCTDSTFYDRGDTPSSDDPGNDPTDPTDPNSPDC